MFSNVAPSSLQYCRLNLAAKLMRSALCRLLKWRCIYERELIGEQKVDTNPDMKTRLILNKHQEEVKFVNSYVLAQTSLRPTTAISLLHLARKSKEVSHPWFKHLLIGHIFLKEVALVTTSTLS